MKQDNDRKDVPRKTGVIAAVLAALLVAAVATVFVVSAKRGSAPVTTDMAAAEPAVGDTLQTMEAPMPSEAAPASGQGTPVEGSSVVAPDQPVSSGAAESTPPIGVPEAEPAPTPMTPDQPPMDAASMPGSSGPEGVPMPTTPPDSGMAPPDMAAPSCDFPQFVGLPADDMKVEEVIKARPHRLLPPGAAVTQDHAPDRINLELDDQGVIRRVWCG
jgi:hypothetical protein